jgi:hypothetical protein
VVCDNRVSDIKSLESLSVDEYYMTINTYLRIIEERNEGGADKATSSGADNNNVKRTSLRK